MKHYLTREKINDLKREFHSLLKLQKENIRNHEFAIKEGDSRECEAWTLSTDLSFVYSARLKEINTILESAEVINKGVKDNVICIGCKASIKINDLIREIQICDSVEANPFKNKISINSELGRRILGKKVGDLVSFIDNYGKVVYIKIIKIF